MGDINPLCFATGKVCCCVQSVGLECPPIWCEPDPCYSQERGICEVNQKMCCMYSEVQFPPSKDIGMGCCGVGCCRTSDDAPPADEAGKETKQRSSHSSVFALQPASLGSNTAMVASSSCPVRMASCLICSLIWIASVASSAAAAIRSLEAESPWAVHRQLMFACHSRVAHNK